MPAPLAGYGILAAAGLMQALFESQQQREAQARQQTFDREMQEKAERLAKEQAARDRLSTAEQGRIGSNERAGATEQNALQNLLAVFQRSAR